MNKRQLLVGAVGLGAAVAGAGWAWWRHQPGEGTPAAVADLWRRQWDSPEGQPVTMAGFQGRPLLINFWATWCPPCVKELPMLDAFHQAHRAQGWQVLGLAIDQPSAVRGFLKQRPMGFPIALAGLDGTELGRALGNTNGGLPFTVVLQASGAVLDRKLGQLSEADLARWRQAA